MSYLCAFSKNQLGVFVRLYCGPSVLSLAYVSVLTDPRPLLPVALC